MGICQRGGPVPGAGGFCAQQGIRQQHYAGPRRDGEGGSGQGAAGAVGDRGGRAAADNVQAGVVSVGIRYHDLSYFSHQKLLETPTNLTVEICRAARELFGELWDHRPVRLLGVHTSRVQEEDPWRQTGLFDREDYGKLAAMDGTVDAIRERFGMDAVMRAAFLNQSIDHMSGGISREKREVDYEKVAVL